jgi:hypothetical protein
LHFVGGNTFRYALEGPTIKTPDYAYQELWKMLFQPNVTTDLVQKGCAD